MGENKNELTPMEIQIVKLVSVGLSNRGIAARLFVSEMECISAQE